MKTTQTLITALFSGAHALVADPTGTASTSVVNPGAMQNPMNAKSHG